jgi:hypothetical protein
LNITASAVSLTVADPERSARFLEQRFDFEREMTAEGFVSLTRSRPAFKRRRAPPAAPVSRLPTNAVTCTADERRRPLRQDGPQWDRVWADGRLCRGPEYPAPVNAGTEQRAGDAETAPLPDREYYRYAIDVAAVAEVWRRGSVVASWLLDLTADALAGLPDLSVQRSRLRLRRGSLDRSRRR